MVDTEAPESSKGLFSEFFTEIFTSPLNLALVGVIAFLVYKIFRSRNKVPAAVPELPLPPKLRRDFTVQELRKYKGSQPDGRILLAINGKVFDVTKGRRFYGPGGPYAAFAGRDASRGFATFTVTFPDKDYDDLSDLNSMEMESIKEWEIQFKEKYDYVGRLLKPGEEPTNYSDEEEESSNVETEKDKEKPKSE